MPTFNDNTMSDCVRTMRLAYEHYGKPEHLESALSDGWALLSSEHKPFQSYGVHLALVADRVSTHEFAAGRVKEALKASGVFLDGPWQGFPLLEAKRLRFLLQLPDSDERSRAIEAGLTGLQARVGFDKTLENAQTLAMRRVDALSRELRRQARDGDWVAFAEGLTRVEGNLR